MVYEDGKSDGEKIGLRKGREEGRTEEKKEIARKLKEFGMDFDNISQTTGLSKEDIEKL